jgi:signal transduction histidine kinase
MDERKVEATNERLRELAEYDILETGAETAFDQLAYLAAKVAGTPIALLSFLDLRRQWVKASYGIEISEIDLELTACQYTIRQEEVYEIEDGAACGWPSEYLRRHNLRYYAGIPIKGRGNVSIGVLCVIDRGVRKLSDEQLKLLRTVAQQIRETLEIRREYQENLRRLNTMYGMRLPLDKRLMDLVHLTTTRTFAELASGLIFRLRPLAMNVQNLELLLRNPSYEITPEDLEVLFDTGHAILRVTDSLDTFVRSQREKSMKPLDLGTIISEAIALLEFKLRDSGIVIQVRAEDEFRCVGSYYMLTKALYCVLVNAVEAVQGRKDQRVEVTLKYGDGRALILVSDSGPGIPESIREFIFYPFFSTKAEAGMGVGLALARSLLQEHGGDVRLVSGAHPTTFELSIPIPQQ